MEKQEWVNKHGICGHCKDHLSANQRSTTSMVKHLQTKHKAEYKIYLSDRIEEQHMGKEDEAELQDIADKQVQLTLGKRTPTKGGTGITLKALQGGLDKYFNVDKFAPSDTNQLKFDMHLMTMITQCNLPFNFVERSGFKKFMSVVSPRVAVKSATDFSRTKLPLVYDNMKRELATILQKDLADVDGVGFTSDGWAAKNQECFQSLTMH